MAIRIITDTSSDFDPSALRGRSVGLVPMTINVGAASYADGIDLTHADFYEMLLSDGEAPKTSQPIPQDFLDHFERAKAAGDDVIAILISGELSGTVQSAQAAKDMCGYDRIHIVDSRCASAGIQMMVDETERMANAGESVEAILDRLESMIRRMRIYLGLDTLKYLYRGGRLTRLEAGVGMLANIHPLLALKDGTLEVCAKCMGTKKTMRRLVEIIESVPADPSVPEAVHLFLRRFPLPRADARVPGRSGRRRGRAGADAGGARRAGRLRRGVHRGREKPGANLIRTALQARAESAMLKRAHRMGTRFGRPSLLLKRNGAFCESNGGTRMKKIGFDSQKYIRMQSERIRERIAQFGGKLYLEFGGKLFDDYHASRVLPGFAPDNKIQMLLELKDQAEIVIAINANDIEKNKRRGDLGITYDTDVMRLVDVFPRVRAVRRQHRVDAIYRPAFGRHL